VQRFGTTKYVNRQQHHPWELASQLAVYSTKMQTNVEIKIQSEIGATYTSLFCLLDECCTCQLIKIPVRKSIGYHRNFLFQINKTKATKSIHNYKHINLAYKKFLNTLNLTVKHCDTLCKVKNYAVLVFKK
jgi:hypothetical protein